MNRKKIIIFGVGRKYQYIRKKYDDFLQKYDIVVYLDNNRDLWERMIDGRTVMSPEYIQKAEYDAVILIADYIKDMKEQMLGFGVPDGKIFLWDEFFCKAQQGTFFTHRKTLVHGTNERLLLISVELRYNGGTMAIINAAMALCGQGYDVTLSAPDGDSELIKEIVRNNISVIIVPAINYPEEAELSWIQQFDVVIVNVFQMIRCACEISRVKPVIWWIHECSNEYEKIYFRIRDNYSEYDNLAAMSNIRIVAVSCVAVRSFNSYYKGRIKEILPYGIQDKYSYSRNNTCNKCIFAVIGNVSPLKAQLIFLDAVSMINQEEKRNAEFWIIGHCGEDSYSNEVRKKAEGMTEVKLLGELGREQIQKKYEEISVIVCSSMEETMSMTVTEGMMNEKVCITTDKTGMADYIEDGGNGLICHAGDIKSLCEKMKWVLEHNEQCKEIAKNARTTYETYFTLEKFSHRLQKVIKSVMEESK